MHHSPRSPFLALSLCLPLLGCPGLPTGVDDDDESNGTTTTESPTPGVSSGAPLPPTTDDPTPQPGGSGTTMADPEGTSSSSGVAEVTGPPILFDFPPIPEAPPFDEQCGEVDFLFVIDNSGSMGDEQASLVANFPAFINGIQTVLETVDSYQVGVVTTDAYTYNVPGCNQLSSLVVQTGGGNSSNSTCGPYDEGNNYMTEMDDLATAFSCAAQVGTSGSAAERPMQAVVETVQRIEGDPGECNEGFIREEALLVIVIITDESDTDSIGFPMTWYDEVLVAKAGIPENVVVVSIINTPGGGCGFDDALGMAMFTDMWGDNGFQVPICAPDYAPFFDEAIAIIDVACENYIPPN
ncbi:MAG: vWA domain-containing protein [Myxococcota bacterium]